MENLTGRQFGPYQIVAPLGEGGMAAVYKAYQPAMERYVALKVLPRNFAEDAEFVARFHREAKLLAQLQHPHILPVFDYGQSDDYAYIVMPFIQSGILTDLLKGDPLPLPRIRQIVSQIGDALNYAHAHGVIHRDVKPSNVLIDEGGNCLLTDFGLARMVEASVNLTTSGAIIGTPAYMSPEQGSGQKIDARSDIYSLGVILYEMATGRVPYKAETPIAVVFKHIQDPLPPARSINPELPEAVELVILKSLSKSPEDRYQTAGEMVQAIQAAIQDAPASSVLTSLAKTPGHPNTEAQAAMGPKKTDRAAFAFVRLWGAIGVLAVVIVGALLAIFGGGLNPANQNPPPAATLQPAETLTPVINTLTPVLNLLAPGTILFQEDFEDANPLAFTYVENGNWKQLTDETGNKVYEIDNRTETGYPQIRFGKSSWKNYAIEFRTRILDFTSSQSMVFCVFRLQGEHYDQLSFTPQSISLGTEPPFQEFGGKSISGGKGLWYSIRIEAQGAQLRVYLDDELAIETSDARLSQGDMTIGVGPGTYAQFDDIKVTALDR